MAQFQSSSSHPTRRSVLNMAAGFALPAVTGAAWSQTTELPALAKIIVGSPPGGLVDIFARRTAEGLVNRYAKSVIVENKVGASGQLAVSAVKSSAADGLTILFTPSPMVTIYPYTYKKLPYNPSTDLSPVSIGAVYDLAFVAGPMVPASVTNLEQFISWCRAEPAKAQFGTPALGSTPHFLGEMIKRHGRIDLTVVPYRGTVPAITDMIGGQIAAVCAPLGDFKQFIDAGKCRVLATAGSKRGKFSPKIATFAEQGISNAVTEDWFAFFLPGGASAKLITQLNETLKVVLNDPKMIKDFAERAVEPKWTTPQYLASSMSATADKWAPFVRLIGFNADS
jgi:tripartite-type tricarboxylate transporter receptor subunit TctC